MRVAVECLQAVQAAKHESENGLACQLTLRFIPSIELGKAHARRELGGEDALAAERRDHVGNVDERMAAVPIGEQPLVRRFDAVVELLADAIANLVDERLRVEVLEQHRCRQHRCLHAREIGFDRVLDSGVLHLHRDGFALVCDGTVHLTDRRRRDRHRVPFDKQLLGRSAELALDHLGRKLRAHRRRVGLQLFEGLAHRLRHAVVDEAGHLAELHHHALHVPERGGHVFSSAQLEFGIERVPSLGRRKHPPSAIARDGAADARTESSELCATRSSTRGVHRASRCSSWTATAHGEHQCSSHGGGPEPPPP
jgi:hypothetical protein